MFAVLLIALAAQPNPWLTQAKLYQQSGDYKQCLKRLEQARNWESSREEQVEIALYGGLCAAALLKTKDAEAEFKRALALDPSAKLPPFSSPKVVAMFEALRPPPSPAAAPEPAPASPEPAPEAQPPAPALAAPEVVPAPANDELREAPPPPPRRAPVVPLMVGGVAVAALGVGLGLGVNASSVGGRADAAEFQSDAYQLRQSAEASALGANAAYGIAAAAAVAALVLFLVTRAD